MEDDFHEHLDASSNDGCVRTPIYSIVVLSTISCVMVILIALDFIAWELLVHIAWRRYFPNLCETVSSYGSRFTFNRIP